MEKASKTALVEVADGSESLETVTVVNVGITVRNRDHLAMLMRRLRRNATVINAVRHFS